MVPSLLYYPYPPLAGYVIEPGVWLMDYHLQGLLTTWRKHMQSQGAFQSETTMAEVLPTLPAVVEKPTHEAASINARIQISSYCVSIHQLM